LLWLEIESSSLAGLLIEPRVAACPAKRLVLTIGDGYTWCDWWIDHDLNRPVPPS
jgi:hypothetical protein